MTEASNIFIADDHQLIIDGIQSMLKSNKELNFVCSANDGLEAKALLIERAQEIDLLITDINMPGISGVELCYFVKEFYPHIMVLIMSMYDNKTVIRQAILAEADGYILKSAGKSDFQKALQKILGGNSYFSESIIPIILEDIKKDEKHVVSLAVLTDREQEVLKLIVDELSSEEIAKKLFISVRTVHKHRANILHKTQVKSTIGLVKFAFASGLIPMPI